MKLGGLLQYRKDPRFVVTVALVIVAITTSVYYLVQRAKELSPEALSSRLLLFVLWNINLLLILGIFFVLLRGVIKLVLDRQRGVVGSKFRTRLVVTYVATSLVPIVLLFLIATDLLRVSIDRWFTAPVRTLLSNSEKIAQSAQDQALSSAAGAAREAAASIANGSEIAPSLQHVRQYHDVDVVAFYRDGAMVTLYADPRAPVHEISDPSARFFEELGKRRVNQKIDVTVRGKWLRSAVAIDRQTSVIVGIFLPADISRMIDQNIIAQREYEQLRSQKETFKASQTSLFLAVTLYILFGTLWTAIYVSRRITVPITALAEGTRTLAQGEFGHRVQVKAGDEFGLLVDSFNTMAEQIESQRAALTSSNDEMQRMNMSLAEERAYLSTVLESVSTGIVAMDGEGRLLSINQAARRILQLEQDIDAKEVSEVFRGELTPVGDYFASVLGRNARSREVTLIRSGELHYLELSAARLEGVTGDGWVVAIEDSTQLVQAQKLAAWSEAARRIAHEIKNPLTPIQLSAERIARKYRNNDRDFGQVVEDGCKTIVNEVGHLKQMVDEFSRFARMPAIHLRRTPLREIFDDVAALYREMKPGVRIEVSVEPELNAVVDPEQIRRALINLLDNAIQATESGTIQLCAKRRSRSIIIEVADPGSGVPDGDKEKLFLPYFSTRERGTGLGLAIVHRIIHDHDGQISVHDNSPKGTRFEIELPA